MPYIKKESRDELEPYIYGLIDILPPIPGKEVEDGEVNYVITRIVNAFYNRPSYKILQRGLGVLEAVKQEFYRRVVAPYEDMKRYSNGDVYI